jgi:hypothetical protein
MLSLRKCNKIVLCKGETSMTNPILLNETEDQSRRMVQLDAWHEIDHEGSVSVLITASMTQAGVKLRRMSSAEPQESFYMDANAADAFCKAWADFKEAQEAQKKAEEERKNTLIAEAYAIARKHPEIKIEADNETHPRYWDVSIPAQGYGFCSPAYYPVNLLEQVKTCHAALQGQTASGGDAA